MLKFFGLDAKALETEGTAKFKGQYVGAGNGKFIFVAVANTREVYAHCTW